MTKKYLKTFWSSLVIKEMQIKKSFRFHLIPLRMAKINKETDSKCWSGVGKGESLFTVSENANLVQSL